MTRRIGWGLAGGIPLAFLAVFFAWPVGALLARGLFGEGAAGLSGFAAVLASPRTGTVVATTLAQAAAGTVVSLALGLPCAWVLYRTRFLGRGLVRAVVTIPFALPSVVVGVAFKSLVIATGPLGAWGLDGTWAIVVASLAFFNVAVVVRTVGALWASLDPRPGQVAAVLGASPPRVLLTVTLPALAPAIASSAALVFLFCASAYGVVMVLGGPTWGTIETEIWFLTQQLLDLTAAAALSIIQLGVVTACLLVTNRLQLRLAHAQRLRTDERVADRWRWRRDLLPSIPVAGVVVLVALPLTNLGLRSLRTASGYGLDHYVALFTGLSGPLAVPVTSAVGMAPP